MVRLTTKIPNVTKMRHSKSWSETTRLRTEGARILVDAAMAEHVPIYIHESVTFLYRDGGDRWLHEGAPTDDGNSAILRGAFAGEREALRFSEAGGRGVVLRFGGFYGPDAPSTLDTIRMAQLRRLPQFGSGVNFFSSIYTVDAGRAVAAALQVPAGIYNVTDDEPIRFYEYIEAVARAARARKPLHLPGFIGRWVFWRSVELLFAITASLEREIEASFRLEAIGPERDLRLESDRLRTAAPRRAIVRDCALTTPTRSSPGACG